MRDLTVSHIVAMAENRVIGRAGGLPWHIPEDFKFFKATTSGHALIMGRKTFESIGRPLPGRLSLVVTRQAGWQPASTDTAPAKAFPSVDAALDYARSVRERWGDEVFVIGGGELYKETLPIADRIYQTLVHQTVEGDTFYPELPEGRFALESERAGADGRLCTFRVLARA